MNEDKKLIPLSSKEILMKCKMGVLDINFYPVPIADRSELEDIENFWISFKLTVEQWLKKQCPDEVKEETT